MYKKFALDQLTRAIYGIYPRFYYASTWLLNSWRVGEMGCYGEKKINKQ